MRTKRIRFSRSSSPAEIRDGHGWTPEEVRAWSIARELGERLEAADGAIDLVVAGDAALEDLPAGAAVLAAEERRLERREFAVSDLALEERAEGDGEELPTIHGYAAVFDVWSPAYFGMVERIAAGAFSSSIARDDVRALWNHDRGKPLGRNTKGTLRLSEDDHGLRMEIDPPRSSWGRDAVEAIRRGDVDQASFGFYVEREEYNRIEDGPDERTLLEVELFDVSPVTFAYYPTTEVEVTRALVGAGIPALELGQVLGRLGHGEELRGSDRGVLEAVLGRLRELVPESVPEATRTPIQVLSRRLELLEAEFG